MSRNVPLKELTTIEFKSTWRIPDKPPKDSDKQGVCYNHSFVLTDLLVCWDFKWPADHQVACFEHFCKSCAELQCARLWSRPADIFSLAEVFRPQ